MEIIVNDCRVTLSNLDSIISYKKKLSQSVFNLETELKEMRHLNSLKRMIIPKIKHINFIL